MPTIFLELLPVSASKGLGLRVVNPKPCQVIVLVLVVRPLVDFGHAKGAIVWTTTPHILKTTLNSTLYKPKLKPKVRTLNSKPYTDPHVILPLGLKLKAGS